MTESSFIMRGTAAGHTLRFVGIESTKIVEEAKNRHKLSQTSTAALGRLLSASSLLAVVLGKNEGSRVSVRVDGGGCVGWMVAEGSLDGQVRGYVRNPDAEAAPKEDGSIDVAGIVGTDGEIAVTRLLDSGEPYTGSVRLKSGEIADDLSNYLAASEQIMNAVFLSTQQENGKVSSAGGLLIQTMPGVKNETLDRLEKNIKELGGFGEQMKQFGIQGVMEKLSEGLGLQLSKKSEAGFKCRCSRQRALDSLQFFGSAEKQEMMSAGGQEVMCHWCNESYQITPDEIMELGILAQNAQS